MKSSFVVLAFIGLLSFSCPGISPQVQADPAAPSTPPAPTATKALPKIVDLRTQFSKFGLPIKDQGRRDTCAVFTLTGALEFALAHGLGQNGVRLSEEYLNWAANQANSDREDGASYEDLINAFDKWGITEQRLMPYDARFRNAQPTERALSSAQEIWKLGFQRHWIAQRTENGLEDSHLAQMRKVLALGWPLCAYGRDHSILLVGYTNDGTMPGGGQFITRNSATRRYETIYYEASKSEFGSVLWIELPEQAE